MKLKMKKILFLAALLLAMQTTMAQEPLLKIDDSTSGIDTTQLQQVSELLRRGENKGELTLAIGSHSITIGEAKGGKNALSSSAVDLDVKRRRCSFGITAFELGYSLLNGLSYAGYDPAVEGFMDQRIGKSIHIGWRVLDMEFYLNRAQNLSLITGVTVSFDDYCFYSNWSIEKVGDRIEPIALEGMKKSKLSTSQIGIPLGLKYRPARKVELSAFLFGELIGHAYTKVKKPKTKTDMRGLNHLRYGVQATATYHNIGFYVKYTLTPLFRSGVGPECYPISVGLAWGF